MRTLTETLDLIAKESGKARFDNHMSGSMIPRGLDFWAIAKTLSIVYPEATYDNTVKKFDKLEDHYFDQAREAHIAAYNKRHNKA